MLRDGKSTPDFVISMLSVFGNNPHGEPLFRLIWSERKMIHFVSEICPEYTYIDPPAWILEAWLPPEKDCGTPADWERQSLGLMGPYPSKGVYNFVKEFPQDWAPTEESVRLICVGIMKSRDVPISDRVKAIRANKEAEAAVARQKVADEIVELQDSASRGLITQPASGQKNNFRTVEDYERDLERGIVVDDLPRKGGKIY